MDICADCGDAKICSVARADRERCANPDIFKVDNPDTLVDQSCGGCKHFTRRNQEEGSCNLLPSSCGFVNQEDDSHCDDFVEGK